MTLLWTKSKLPIGPLICWGLETNVSHFAVCFHDCLVLHSNFLGVHIQPLKDFISYSDIVYKKTYQLNDNDESLLLVNIMKRYYGKRYDWKWLFSLVWAVILFKLLRRNNMDSIRWRSRDEFLCTEVAEFLEPVIGKVDIGNGSPMVLARNLGVK